jgi:hypothetical protein
MVRTPDILYKFIFFNGILDTICTTGVGSHRSDLPTLSMIYWPHYVTPLPHSSDTAFLCFMYVVLASLESYFDGGWNIRDFSPYIRMCSFYRILISSLIPSFRLSLCLSVCLSLSLSLSLSMACFLLFTHFLSYFYFLPLSIISYQFLTAFEKLRIATVNFVSSVCPSVSGPHWTDCHEIWYLSISRKSVGKIEVLIKCKKE